ncbi:LamG-like jellyroll fold domain-containing protein [Nonomuraea basaltis]|uniref:LamG-like jellyroll fold domain-containing protein n=1 Tax=Nonomuraea basaltis TaxID=2495887 RepID=UPI00110C6290|nr:LamG-like jellyroll fold domain-containing protein [Nonomuraea basaltis]TMR99524.1 hypothetical protein EJK15_06845 [Nonomuraea basaltis]
MAIRYAAASHGQIATLSLGQRSALTVSCWVKISVDRNAESPVWTIDPNSTSSWLTLRTGADGTTMRVLINGTQVASRAFTPGVWYFVGVSVSSTGGFMVSRAAGTASFNVDTWTNAAAVMATLLRLGVSIDGLWLNGCIAAFKLWTDALTQTEVQAEAGDYLPQRKVGLGAAYAFYRAESTDYSGNGRELSVDTGATAASGPAITWGGASVPLAFEDIEDPTYAFTWSGNWTRVSTSSTTPAQAGSWSLRSAVIGDNGTTSANVIVPDGCDRLRFWYRVSSESGFDFFRFLIAGVEQFTASGPGGSWTQSPEYTVTPGTTVTFRYTKDGSSADPQNVDAAFIDNVEFYSSASPITPVALPAKSHFDGGFSSGDILPSTSGGGSWTAFTEVAGRPVFTDPGRGNRGFAAYQQSSNAEGRLSWRYTPPAGDVVCARLYINPTGTFPAAKALFGLVGPSGAVSKAWLDPATMRIAVRVGDLVTGTQTVLTGVSIPKNTWTRIEFRYTINASGSGTVEVWTYLSPDSLTHNDYVISSSTAWPGGKPQQADFWLWTAQTNWFILDDVAIGAAKLGPAVNIAQLSIAGHSGVALPITARKVHHVGPATAVETVLTARPVRVRQLGAAVEDGGAAAVRPQKLRVLGQVEETAGSAAAAPAHARRLGATVEHDTAQPVSAEQGPIVRTTSETSTAMPMAPIKVRHVGMATTTDVAQPPRPVHRRLLGVAAEMSSGGVLTRVKRRRLGLAVETSAVEEISSGFLVMVVEADTALPVTPLLYGGGPFTGVEGPRRSWGAEPVQRRWGVEPPRRTWSASRTRGERRGTDL